MQRSSSLSSETEKPKIKVTEVLVVDKGLVSDTKMSAAFSREDENYSAHGRRAKVLEHTAVCPFV
jgi:hypothetical protein